MIKKSNNDFFLVINNYYVHEVEFTKNFDIDELNDKHINELSIRRIWLINTKLRKEKMK